MVAIKKAFLYVLMFFIFSYVAFATSPVAHYKFNSDLTDSANGYNLTNTSVIIDNSMYAVGTGAVRGTSTTGTYAQYTTNVTKLAIGNADFAISVWFRPNTTNSFSPLVEFGQSGSYQRKGIWCYAHTDGFFNIAHGSEDWATGINCQATKWYHVVVVYNASTKNEIIYINGTNTANHTFTNALTNTQNTISALTRTEHDLSTNGWIDDYRIYNSTISAAEVACIFNSGTGTEEEDACTTGPSNFTITATDEWTGSSLNISVWVDGTSYGTNTTITTDLLSNSTTLHNITIGATDYFNRTYTDYNVSSNLAGQLHQAEVCFNATAKVSEAAVTLNNVTINSAVRTASPFCFNISASTINVKAQKTGWFSKNQSFSIAALSNTTETIVNLSYANLTISARDASTNASLSGYDLTIRSLNYTGWTGEDPTGVTNYSFYLINGTYNVTIDVPGYELTSAQANVTVNGNTNYTFTLYKQNSIRITIRDEITNDLINTTTITARFTDNATTWENTTSTGYLFVYNLTPATYTILFYGGGYSTRTYTVTVGDRSTQTLTAYMLSSNYSTTFTIKDADTADTIDNVSVSMYKLINSTWTIVESKYSDVSGRALFYYDPIGSYKFYLSKPEYVDYVFFLNPILFSSYDVYMSKTSLLNASEDFEGLAIIYAPQSFANNNVTTFNFIISSPDGLLTEYGINLTYPTGGQVNQTGYNAIGSQLGVSVNVTNATAYDRVRLDYYYITSTVGRRNFTVYFPIEFNVSAADLTFLSNKNKTYGLGIFERILIITIVVLFVVGIATLVGQPIPGLGLGLFCFGYMAYIGFVPLWAILPSMFIGVLFLVWKSGGY